MCSTRIRILTLLCGAFLVLATLAPGVYAQDLTFLVQRTQDGKNTQIWHATCSGLKPDATKVACTLTRQTCTTDCKFTNKSTDFPPVPLIFGISSFNQTCAWVYDSASYRYTYRCW